MPLLSVIIPALDEAAQLPALLQALQAQRGLSLELWIADGGSRDGSPAIAETRGARVCRSERGRGRQMNAAARQAAGEFLLFLHADSAITDPQLLAGAVAALQAEIARRGHDRCAGHFRLQFLRRDRGRGMAWRYLEEKTAFNRPYTFNGDQGLLLTRRYFDELGGFDERLPFLEDQRLAARIRAGGGALFTLPGLLCSSGRRFEQAGFHRQYLLMSLIMAMHAAGMDGFFAQAPALYRVQGEAGRLRLLPFFRLARDCARAAGRWQTWLSVGRLARENGWQPFYFCDVGLRPLLGPGRYPFLRFYDLAIAPLLQHRLGDALAAGLLWLHLQLVVLPWCAWQDRRED